MKIIKLTLTKWPEEIIPSCACIGYFDGVHLGHRALLDKTLDLAKKQGCPASIISFYPDPYTVVNGRQRQHIQSFSQRLLLLEKMGMDIAYVIFFDQETAALSPQDFSRLFLERLQLKALVCGFDFHYGFHGQGDVFSLQQELQGIFPVYKIAEVRDTEGKISSSRIRSYITQGNIQQANACLGYPYFVCGRVVSGRRNGRKMGYPTANIAYSSEQLLPDYGVYSAFVMWEGKRYKAMVNYGKNPTVAGNLAATLEIHILDFCADLYDRELCIYFLRRLRPEMKFRNLLELSEQLRKDEMEVRQEEENGSSVF